MCCLRPKRGGLNSEADEADYKARQITRYFETLEQGSRDKQFSLSKENQNDLLSRRRAEIGSETSPRLIPISKPPPALQRPLIQPSNLNNSEISQPISHLSFDRVLNFFCNVLLAKKMNIQ
jgi:hypothetical protein